MIHPLLCNAKSNFYPRSPYGERPTAKNGSTRSNNFYPRSPYGERRFLFLPVIGHVVISIHALLTESDDGLFFLSRRNRISIHALLTESDDTWARGSRVTYVISIHALLTESDI